MPNLKRPWVIPAPVVAGLFGFWLLEKRFSTPTLSYTEFKKALGW